MGLLVAFGDESFADLPGHVGLRSSDQPPARDLADHAVGRLRGEAQERDLVGVLDHAQLAQDGRRRVVGGRRGDGGLEPEDVERDHRVR